MSEEYATSAPAAAIVRPPLIVVTGRPGAGKSTLAHALARAVRCPLLSRDEIKEGLVHATGELGEPGGEAQRLATDVFFEALAVLLGRGVTVVAEAAFQHRVWAPRLEALRERARVRLVLCQVPPDVARARHVERGLADPAQERFHHDHVVRVARAGGDWRALPIGEYEMPRSDFPTLVVETAEGYRPAFEEIVAFARA
jgi:predicted kinase